MADDDNDTAAELPAEEENNVGGDIEQGRPSSSWVAAAISGRTSTAGGDPSTTTTAWHLGGLEHVDDAEEAAPVPLIQQIADMDMADIEKGNTNAIITNTGEAPQPQPLKQGAMEQIEDGDDAAPRPFNYAEFEDYDSQPKLDLGEEESTDEDGGPPLPLSQQRDSLSDAKKMAATSQISSSAAPPVDGNQSIGGDPNVGDEGNNTPILQRVVGPENRSASDNERARRVVSSSAAAAERYPSVPIIEAYLVEEEEEVPLTANVTQPPRVPIFNPEGHDTVYEATPLEPELPWWKQRRTKVFMVIICVLLAALALSVGLGVKFSRPTAVNTSATTITTTTPTTSSIATTDASSSSSVTLSPSNSPSKPSYRCFADRNELKTVVDRYVKDGCGAVATLCSGISDTYGWPMGSWCVIDVTDMSSLFQGLETFNEDISMWNVGQVTDMSYMFAEAGTFNRDISSWNWNISSVTNMSYMFKGATSFNQNMCAWKDNFPYSNAIDIFVDSGCTYKGTPSSETKGPFCASSCNIATAATDCFTTRDELKAAVDRYVQGYWGAADSSKYGWPIGSWCVGKVTDMSSLFESLETFNEDISRWEVGQVTNMNRMFLAASSFNQNVSNWDTSAVTNMMSMFWGALSFDQDLSKWNTSAVTDMEAMFYNTTFFNQDLSKWNTSAVTTMRSLFNRALAFNSDISPWDTSAVTDMMLMFWGASSFNQQDLTNWDTSAVTDMSWMFSYASNFNGNISSWNTSAVTDMSHMFRGASSFNQNISSWDTSAVTDMSYMFEGATAFDGDLSSWDTSAVTDMSYAFFPGSTSKLGEWEKCSDSKQCENQCCSSKWSEGVLKCTPVDGFKPWEGCVGSATRLLRGISEDEALTVSDETTTTFTHNAAPVEELGRDIEYGLVRW